MSISPFDRSVTGDNINVSKLLLVDLINHAAKMEVAERDTFWKGYKAAMFDLLCPQEHSAIDLIGQRRINWERDLEATRKQLDEEAEIVREYRMQQQAKVPPPEDHGTFVVNLIHDEPTPDTTFDDPLN